MKTRIDKLVINAIVILLFTSIVLIAMAMNSCTKIEYIEIVDTVTIHDTVIVKDIGIKDGSGNKYDTIRIGDQVWINTNLITTKYNDGTDILYPGTDKQLWISSNEGCYAWYNNDSATNSIYGALYNWKAVMSNKLCPQGYRVPSDNDWQILEMFLGMSKADADRYGIRGDGGGKLKGTKYWSSPNVGATDQYGFNAIPSNIRYYNGEYWPWQYSGIESVTYWTATYDSNLDLAINRSLQTNSSAIWKWRHSVLMGYSVRCIKN